MLAYKLYVDYDFSNFVLPEHQNLDILITNKLQLLGDFVLPDPCPPFAHFKHATD